MRTKSRSPAQLRAAAKSENSYERTMFFAWFFNNMSLWASPNLLKYPDWLRYGKGVVKLIFTTCEKELFLILMIIVALKVTK